MHDQNKRVANRKARATARATDRQRSELARRKAMGIALVLSPLKFLKERTSGYFKKDLIKAAANGNGLYVQQTALRTANAT